MNSVRIEWRSNFAHIMAMLVAVLSFAMIFLCQGCDNLKAPPVSVTFRESLLKGAVLQLHNCSDGRVVCNVHVKSRSKNQSKCSSFGIPPNDMVEVGLLEMDWSFEAGEQGHVAVDGYRKKIYFEIMGDGYRTYLGL